MRIPKYHLGVALLILTAGTLARAQQTITISDLVGRWGFGDGAMLTYLDHGTGNYSHSGNIYGFTYTVKRDGTFYYAFAARVGKQTIRQWGQGTVVLSAGSIIFKFYEGPADKYRIVSLESGSENALVLSLVQSKDKAQPMKCGHSTGYFDCSGRQEWMLRRPGS